MRSDHLLLIATTRVLDILGSRKRGTSTPVQTLRFSNLRTSENVSLRKLKSIYITCCMWTRFKLSDFSLLSQDRGLFVIIDRTYYLPDYCCKQQQSNSVIKFLYELIFKENARPRNLVHYLRQTFFFFI